MLPPLGTEMEILNLITQPVKEPVVKADVKEALRLTHAADDTFIDAVILQSRKLCEEYTGRAFVTQTWEYILDKAPRRIILPYPPVSSITKIEVTDEDGNATTVSTSIYDTLLLTSEPSTIWLPSGNSWPAMRTLHGFKVTFVAGYGADAANVPATIKQGIIALAVYLYEHRGDNINPNIAFAQSDAFKMLMPLKAFHDSFS